MDKKKKNKRMDSTASYMAKRRNYDYLVSQLKNERSTFKPQWQDSSTFISPRRSRFFISDSNKGDRRNHKIIDSTATMALRTLRSGMMSGITSPARPWFRLTIPDFAEAESGPVKEWLHQVTQNIKTVFLKSNLYNVLPQVYGDLGTFGTGALYMEEDFESVATFFSFPIGSYMIATDHKNVVNTFVREFRMTVAQVVSKFGSMDNDGNIDWSTISDNVKVLFEANNLHAWVNVTHVIKPNQDYRPNNGMAKYKKYSSVYYERGSDASGSGSNGLGQGGTQATTFLRESGYDFFPVLVPRWETTGEDVYGTDCPAFTAIGDIKQLQKGEERSLQAIDKKVNPPMIGSSKLKTAAPSVLPGDITYTDGSNDADTMFRPIYQVNFDINELEQKQEQVRKRISRAFFEDLFLMLAQSDRRQITAREIDERHEEKLLALGPVLEQLNQDLLDPLIDNIFFLMEKQGLLPPAPEAIAGVNLKVEYVSIMAQAQKLTGLGAVERFLNITGALMDRFPDAGIKVDAEQVIDFVGDLTSVPPGIVRSDEEVQEIKQAQQAAQQQAAQQEQMNQMADTAKKMSETSTEGETALTAIQGGLSG